MDKQIRWRITLWFMCLSTMVYVVPTLLSLFLFNLSLTADLDSELAVFSASFGHAIHIEGGKPVFRDWARTVQTDPAKTPASIQLFDRCGNLLDKYGIPGASALNLSGDEVHDGSLSMRLRVTPLKLKDDLVGYLQIGLPTEQRDLHVRQLALIMTLIGPMVLIGLGWCSYQASAKAIEPIKQSNEMLRRFVADASHELNTPLSIIQAAAESQEKKMKALAIESPNLDTINGALTRMSRIVDDLLLLSQLENNTPAPQTTSISIKDLVANAVRELMAKYLAKGVDLQVLSVADLTILGDADGLHRLLLNLLENALAYTERSGQVTVSALAENSFVNIHIVDTGIGIPPESIARVFDRFYRVDNSRSRKSGGSGLGLAIAKAIAKAHNGDVSVSSNVESGSDFVVSLPAP